MSGIPKNPPPKGAAVPAPGLSTQPAATQGAAGTGTATTTAAKTWGGQDAPAKRWHVGNPPRTISQQDNRALMEKEDASLKSFLSATVGKRLRVVDNDPGAMGPDGNYGVKRTVEGVFVGIGLDAKNNKVMSFKTPEGKTITHMVSTPRNLTLDLL